MKNASNVLEKIHVAQGDTPVYANLHGLLKLAELDIEGARKDFADLAQKDPTFLPAKINLARVLAMEGRSAEAEKILATILAQHPASEPALTMLARDYAASGDAPKAVGLFEKAHQAVPNNTTYTATLGRLYIGSGSAQKAIDLANSQKGGNASAVPIMAMKAAAFIALGQKDQAIAVDTDLLKSDPGLAGVRHQLVSLSGGCRQFRAGAQRRAVRLGCDATQLSALPGIRVDRPEGQRAEHRFGHGASTTVAEPGFCRGACAGRRYLYRRQPAGGRDQGLPEGAYRRSVRDARTPAGRGPAASWPEGCSNQDADRMDR